MVCRFTECVWAGVDAMAWPCAYAQMSVQLSKWFVTGYVMPCVLTMEF